MCCLLWACAVALNGIFNMQTTCETLVCLSQISFCLFEDLPNCLSVLYPLSSTDFHRRISWKHSRPSWMGPWVARCGGWQPWLRQGSWNWMIFKVSSSLSLSMILWLYDSMILRLYDSMILHSRPLHTSVSFFWTLQLHILFGRTVSIADVCMSCRHSYYNWWQYSSIFLKYCCSTFHARNLLP